MEDKTYENKLISERNTKMTKFSILFDILNNTGPLKNTDLQEHHPGLRLKQYQPALKSVPI